jgi:hypothetical protein
MGRSSRIQGRIEGYRSDTGRLPQRIDAIQHPELHRRFIFWRNDVGRWQR